MTKITQEYFNLKQTAEYLGIGESTAKREWPGWVDKYGLVPSRFPSRTLKFKKSDLDKLMQATKVQ